MDPSAELWALVNGYQVTEALYVVAELGISDLLAEQPRTVDDLAGLTSSHAPSLHRVLRALTTVGVYEVRPDGTYANTAVGDVLRRDAPDSVAAWARLIGRKPVREAWAGLLDGVRTGEHPFRAVHGTDPWEHRRQHPAETVAFDDAMTALSAREARRVVDAYDFTGLGTVVDVGGGRGRLLAEVLRANPDVRGVLLELPHVLEHAPTLLAEQGVETRVLLVPGDFFRHVPAGGDAYMLKSVVHDWPDAEAVELLTCCREAMAPGARLLLVERVLGRPGQERTAAFSDLNMLVMPGGRERTEDEYAALLTAAGLTVSRVVPTAGGFGVVESFLR